MAGLFALPSGWLWVRLVVSPNVVILPGNIVDQRYCVLADISMRWYSRACVVLLLCSQVR